MNTRELTCINCPVGCKITIEWDDATIKTVSGNKCPKGEAYARKEVTDPRRIVTSTVEIIGGEEVRLPVKTKQDIPKGKIFGCVRALKDIQVQAPIEMGDVILSDVAGTGIDVVATKCVKACLKHQK